jgi:hypothetical protein
MFVLDQRWTSEKHSDPGQLSAVCWFAEHGALVSQPLFANADYDLLADIEGTFMRVQVRTSTCWQKERWLVRVSTTDGLQIRNEVIEHVDRTGCDQVFVHVADGRRWLVPADALDGARLELGGSKYAAYEIEPASPLPSQAHA